MGLHNTLGKQVRVRAEEDDDDSMAEISTTSADMESDTGEEDEEDESNENHTTNSSELDSESDEGIQSDDEIYADESDRTSLEDGVEDPLSTVSFGALAKAQASLGKRKRSGSTSKAVSDETDPLEDIRARIREAREQKRQTSGSTLDPRLRGKDRDRDSQKASRSSKNAPTIQSSKHAVSRKRIVVEIPNVQKSRDPRFDPAVLAHSGSKFNSAGLNKAYGFLDEYRASEVQQLKDQLAKSKNAEEKERLKRAIRSAEDRQRTIDNRKREQGILTEHKKRERQLMREGKKSQPYYLKKSDLKREVLIKKYESMGAKERTKALTKRRKKVASKEKKALPWARRSVGETTRADGDSGHVNLPEKRRG